MTQPYTDANVELVALADFGAQWPGRDWDAIPAGEAEEYWSDARAILSALAAAGRLRPGPLIGVLIDGRVYHPADVTLMYHAEEGHTAGDSVDEHGNRTDTCHVCTLVPSVSGWARMTQARCPVHGGRPDDTEEETMDADEIREPVNYGGLVVHPGDTLVVWTERLLDAEQADMYRTKLRERLPDLADVVVLNAAGVAAYRPTPTPKPPPDKSWMEDYR